MDPLTDPRDLIKEEVAMHNYLLKTQEVQQENEMRYQQKEA